MNIYIFYIFSVIIFFILVRETIIDIKTMYVPDNITFAIYTTSVAFLIISWFTTQSFQTIKNGILGFLLGFGVPFTISLLSYIIQLVIYKAQKRRGEKQRIESNIQTTEIEKSSTIKKKENNIIDVTKEDNIFKRRWIIKRIFYWIFCLCSIYFLSTIQTAIPKSIYLGIGISILIVIIVFYEKTKKIEIPIYLVAFGMIIMALPAKKNPIFILLTAAAIIIELILAKVFYRFYKIETDTILTEEYDNEGEREIEGGIGGGDILIFGALGLMFGAKGIITILLYALFSQLLIIFSYALLSQKKSPFSHIPFVPGITIGVYLYIMGFDFLNIQQILAFLSKL